MYRKTMKKKQQKVSEAAGDFLTGTLLTFNLYTAYLQ